MKEKDEIKALRQQMVKAAAAGNLDALAALQETIDDLKEEEDDHERFIDEEE